jgi:RNA polymerase II subunit A-like phosphatase
MSQNDDDGIYINKNVKEIRFNLNKSVQVCKIMIHPDTRLTINDAIFIMIDTNGQRQSFVSPISGTITKLYIHELDILSYGSIILEYEECRHTITFKNLCGDCGIDLNQVKHVLSPSNPTKGAISMEPSFPEVTITREEGSKYDDEERNHLLRKRKLHLLVDLDQTLVHTTNSRNYYPPSSDIISYQLNPISPIFYTKLRPGVKEFLTNLLPFYQFHLVTFGDRPYAHTIAKFIDPNKTFFSHRILSRDECLSLTDKAANLSSLFPCGDSLVCIIDDREDVWNYAPNLVHVKPYIWFRDVGDINDTYLPSQNQKREFYSENDELSKQIKEHNPGYVIEDTDLYLCQLEIILKRIHTVFYKAYDQWIQDKHGPMPDLKQIIPNIRQQVLTSVSLCFSHMMPQNYPLEKHPATIIAKALGAEVTSDLQFDSNGTIQTTHVIGGKRTFKVYQAQEKKIKVVTPDWLTDCYEHWEKKLEENYILTSAYKVRTSKLFIEETPRVTKKRCHRDMQQQVPVVEQSLSYQSSNSTMSIDEQLNIEEKVNDLCINNDDDDEFNDIRPRPKKQRRTMITAEIINETRDDHDNEDSDSDSDSSYSRKLHNLVLAKEDDPNPDEEKLSDDEAPRGWKEDQKEKREHS